MRQGRFPPQPPATSAGASFHRDRDTAGSRSRRTASAARSATSPIQIPLIRPRGATAPQASAWQPQPPLGDDVALNLDRPAADGHPPHLDHLRRRIDDWLPTAVSSASAPYPAAASTSSSDARWPSSPPTILITGAIENGARFSPCSAAAWR